MKMMITMVPKGRAAVDCAQHQSTGDNIDQQASKPNEYQQHLYFPDVTVDRDFTYPVVYFPQRDP